VTLGLQVAEQLMGPPIADAHVLASAPYISNLFYFGGVKAKLLRAIIKPLRHKSSLCCGFIGPIITSFVTLFYVGKSSKKARSVWLQCSSFHVRWDKNISEQK
jgi:hypothetical protein